MVINKTQRCKKARFLQNTLKKTPSSGKSLISTYSIFWSGRRKGVGAYLSVSGSGREVGAHSRPGAYSNKYDISSLQTTSFLLQESS